MMEKSVDLSSDGIHLLPIVEIEERITPFKYLFFFSYNSNSWGGKVTNIDYGNVDFEKVNIETVTSTRR